MLKITIPYTELYDENTNEFITVHETTLQLEHSLVSVSKWESKWNKPFLGDKEKTNEEILDYIRCMTVTQNVDMNVYKVLGNDILEKVGKYISASMTATTVRDNPNTPRGQKEIITSEVIYYWMISLNIPFECQKWHLNRLLMLIRVCNAKNETPKKMSQKDIMSRNSKLNAARRKAHGTKG